MDVDVCGKIVQNLRSQLLALGSNGKGGGGGGGGGGEGPLVPLRRAFDRLNERKNAGGEPSLKPKIFFSLLSRLGLNVSPPQRTILARALSPGDGSGRISYGKLLNFTSVQSVWKEANEALDRRIGTATIAAMRKGGASFKSLEGALQAYDEVGRGVLSEGDFLSALQQAGEFEYEYEFEFCLLLLCGVWECVVDS